MLRVFRNILQGSYYTENLKAEFIWSHRPAMDLMVYRMWHSFMGAWILKDFFFLSTFLNIIPFLYWLNLFLNCCQIVCHYLDIIFSYEYWKYVPQLQYIFKPNWIIWNPSCVYESFGIPWVLFLNWWGFTQRHHPRKECLHIQNTGRVNDLAMTGSPMFCWTCKYWVLFPFKKFPLWIYTADHFTNMEVLESMRVQQL